MLLGDSSAVTVGVLGRCETNGFRLAQALVSRLGCAVEVTVSARAGVTTAGMARQVAAVTSRAERGVALILVGGNDVMLPLGLRRPAARLGRYVQELRAAGWQVVVGSGADIGAAPALRHGVRSLAGFRSRLLARRQAEAALSAGAMVVSLSMDVLRQHPARLYCEDAFHPNAEGYLMYVRRVMVAVEEAARRHLGESSTPIGGDGVFADARQAARHVGGEPGACFVPSPCGSHVVLHRHAPGGERGPQGREPLVPAAAS
ncbi:GDSL-type esterase/lipase family protein [Streptomyces sp. NPDC055254]